MIKVRCPRCEKITEDPAEAFPCSGCSAGLRWFQPSAFTTQLALELGGWQQPELPVLHASNPRLPTEPVLPMPEQPAAPLPLDPIDAGKLMVGLITSAMASGDGKDEIRTASLDVFADLSRDQVILLCLAGSQITGSMLKLLDEQADGAGSNYLRMWALAFQEPPQPA